MSVAHDKLCGVGGRKQAYLYRWFANQSDGVRFHVFKLHAELTQKNIHKRGNLSLEAYSSAMFIQAMALTRSLVTASSRKTTLNETEMAQLSEITKLDLHAEKMRKQNRKKTDAVKILYYPLVQQLRGSGYSWESCAKYLKQKKRFKVSGECLRLACIEFECAGKD